MKSAVAFVFLLVCAAAPEQTPNTQPAKGRIEGAVVNAVGGQLLPHAIVIVRDLQKHGNPMVGRADDNAHFVFALDPGSYQVSAGKTGFISDDRKASASPVIDLAAGAEAKDVLVRLVPLAVISGRIVDEANDPVRSVEVRLLAIEHYRGRQFLNTMSSAISDDRGEYRIIDVHPGNYFVLAERDVGKEWEKLATIRPPRGSPLDIAYPPLFYPGTSDIAQAQRLAVSPGDELHADFSLFPVPALSIQGRVVNGLTNHPILNPAVSAFWGECGNVMARTADIIDNGSRFEIRGLGAGPYTLKTSFTDNGESFSDERVVEVGGQGIRNLVISGLPDFDIVGHVRLESGRLAATMPSVEFVCVEPRMGSTFRVGTNRPDYEFSGKLHPGDHYRVSVLNLPQDFYLKSVNISGHEVPSTDVVIGGRHTEIELLVSPAGGHIEGNTLNNQHEPVSGSYVLLVPDASERVGDQIRSTRSDVKGKYAFRGVAPGSYHLFAFEDVDVSEMVNQPDLLKSYSQNAQFLKVEDAGSYALDINPIQGK